MDPSNVDLDKPKARTERVCFSLDRTEMYELQRLCKAKSDEPHRLAREAMLLYMKAHGVVLE